MVAVITPPGTHATPAEREALAAGVCVVCGNADDNLSSLARCWSCISAGSAAWEAKAATRTPPPPWTALAEQLAAERRLPFHLVAQEAERRYEAAQRPNPVPVSGHPKRRLRGLLRTLNDATEPGRNAKLHWVACRVGEMLAVRELADADQAADVLTQVALGTGLDPREVRGTIRSGFSSSGVVL